MITKKCFCTNLGLVRVVVTIFRSHIEVYWIGILEILKSSILWWNGNRRNRFAKCPLKIFAFSPMIESIIPGNIFLIALICRLYGWKTDFDLSGKFLTGPFPKFNKNHWNEAIWDQPICSGPSSSRQLTESTFRGHFVTTETDFLPTLWSTKTRIRRKPLF